MMMTTISVKRDTFVVLRRIKVRRGYRSLDEIIKKMIEECFPEEVTW